MTPGPACCTIRIHDRQWGPGRSHSIDQHSPFCTSQYRSLWKCHSDPIRPPKFVSKHLSAPLPSWHLLPAPQHSLCTPLPLLTLLMSTLQHCRIPADRRLPPPYRVYTTHSYRSCLPWLPCCDPPDHLWPRSRHTRGASHPVQHTVYTQYTLPLPVPASLYTICIHSPEHSLYLQHGSIAASPHSALTTHTQLPPHTSL